MARWPPSASTSYVDRSISGPAAFIETNIDPDKVKIETFLNGEKRQSGATSDLIFPVKRLVSFLSKIMTLCPGDVIATGTPGGIGPMKTGDIVEVKIEGIGSLRNGVAAEGREQSA